MNITVITNPDQAPEVHRMRCPSLSVIGGTVIAETLVSNRKTLVTKVLAPGHDPDDWETVADTVEWAPCVIQLPDEGVGKRVTYDDPEGHTGYNSAEGTPRPMIIATGIPGGILRLYLTASGWLTVEIRHGNVTVTEYGWDENGAWLAVCAAQRT